LKAVSLHQPWASAIAAGLKRFETRSWGTLHRGLLAIHATQRPTDPATLDLELRVRDALRGARVDLPPLPRGAFVALVQLDNCKGTVLWSAADAPPAEREWGDWTPGRFAWRLSSGWALSSPVPCRGAQGLWVVPEPLRERVLRERAAGMIAWRNAPCP